LFFVNQEFPVDASYRLTTITHRPLLLPEEGKVTLKINGDEALSDESV
jgi:hypothetical protein